MVSTPSANGGVFTDSCSIAAVPLPSCDNGPKPDNLTWRYDGGTGGDGDCADSTFFTIVDSDGDTHSDFECTGNVDTSLQITVVDDDSQGISLALPGAVIEGASGLVGTDIGSKKPQQS